MNTAYQSGLSRRVRLLLRLFALAWTSLSLFGCKPQQATPPGAAPAAPKVEGNIIRFETNSPQLGYVSVEPAAERKNSATGLYGRLAWDEDATARIFSPVGGRVLRLLAEVNQNVAEGGPLALLDSPDYAQATADARTGEGNFAAASRAFARTRELLAHGAVAQKDLEAAEAAFIAARAERERAKARLANYGGGIEDTNAAFVLRSPLAGVLVERNINPGQEIRPDLMLANVPQLASPQFVVSDPSRLWLFLDVDETAMTSLVPRQETRVYAAAYPGRVFHGKLEMIGHELDPNTRTLKVRCLVDNSEGLLRAEMYVTADVASAGPAVVEVPTKAVFMKGNGYFVFVETGPGQFECRPVRLGSESTGRTAILEGIQNGQRVVTEGCLLLESLLQGDNS